MHLPTVAGKKKKETVTRVGAKRTRSCSPSFSVTSTMCSTTERTEPTVTSLSRTKKKRPLQPADQSSSSSSENELPKMDPPRGNKVWSPASVEQFIHLLISEVRKNSSRSQTTTFTLNHWSSFVKKLLITIGIKFTPTQLKDRFERFKKELKTFRNNPNSRSCHSKGLEYYSFLQFIVENLNSSRGQGGSSSSSSRTISPPMVEGK